MFDTGEDYLQMAQWFIKDGTYSPEAVRDECVYKWTQHYCEVNEDMNCDDVARMYWESFDYVMKEAKNPKSFMGKSVAKIKYRKEAETDMDEPVFPFFPLPESAVVEYEMIENSPIGEIVKDKDGKLFVLVSKDLAEIIFEQTKYVLDAEYRKEELLPKIEFKTMIPVGTPEAKVFYGIREEDENDVYYVLQETRVGEEYLYRILLVIDNYEDFELPELETFDAEDEINIVDITNQTTIIDVGGKLFRISWGDNHTGKGNFYGVHIMSPDGTWELYAETRHIFPHMKNQVSRGQGVWRLETAQEHLEVWNRYLKKIHEYKSPHKDELFGDFEKQISKIIYTPKIKKAEFEAPEGVCLFCDETEDLETVNLDGWPEEICEHCLDPNNWMAESYEIDSKLTEAYKKAYENLKNAGWEINEEAYTIGAVESGITEIHTWHIWSPETPSKLYRAEDREESERMTRAEAEVLAEKMTDLLEPYCEFVEICGSYRRGREDPGDLDIVIIPKEGETLPEIVGKIAGYYEKYNWIGEKKTQLLVDGVKVDIKVSSLTGLGAALLYFTGPAGYNIGMRRSAKSKGMKLNEYGIWDRDTNEYLGGATEEEIYAVLGKTFRPPEERGAESFSAEDDGCPLCHTELEKDWDGKNCVWWLTCPYCKWFSEYDVFYDTKGNRRMDDINYHAESFSAETKSDGEEYEYFDEFSDLEGHTEGPWYSHPLIGMNIGGIRGGEEARESVGESDQDLRLLLSAPELFEELKACKNRLKNPKSKTFGAEHSYNEYIVEMRSSRGDLMWSSPCPDYDYLVKEISHMLKTPYYAIDVFATDYGRKVHKATIKYDKVESGPLAKELAKSLDMDSYAAEDEEDERRWTDSELFAEWLKDEDMVFHQLTARMFYGPNFGAFKDITKRQVGLQPTIGKGTTRRLLKIENFHIFENIIPEIMESPFLSFEMKADEGLEAMGQEIAEYLLEYVKKAANDLLMGDWLDEDMTIAVDLSNEVAEDEIYLIFPDNSDMKLIPYQKEVSFIYEPEQEAAVLEWKTGLKVVEVGGVAFS